jgi:uncharacterized membrane protein YraQ (UPF0718 family)
VFAIVIGAIMQMLYRREELARADGSARGVAAEEAGQPFPAVLAFFGLMTGMLVFANWAAADSPLWMQVYAWKWQVTSVLALLFAALLVLQWHWPPRQVLVLAGLVAGSALLLPGTPELAFAIGALGILVIAATRDQDREWAAQSWDFSKQILPLLLAGVCIAGFLLGRPGHEGVIPSAWVGAAVGDNSLQSTVIAAVLGAFMYFSTLTEVPIVQGLLGSGMGRGPALALLLAGPALSLPNMLVIRTILGTQKTVVYCALVIVMATIAGYIYGNLW